jgi:hypothetical protein
VDFTLSLEQEMIRDTARELCANECPASLVREHIDNPSAALRPWHALKEWTSVADGNLVDLCLFLEETGASLLPGPFFATTALFMPMLHAMRDAMTQTTAEPESSSSPTMSIDGLLDDVRSGEITGTVAVAGRDARWLANDHLTKHFVPEAERVDLIAVVMEGPKVAIFRRDDVAVRSINTIDPSRHLAAVDISGAVPALAAVDLATAAFDTVIERAFVALSAELMGTTRWLVDSSIEYARQRRQFGKPIGSFQAIKHKLADMALLREQAWSSVYYAAMTHDAAIQTSGADSSTASVTSRRAAHVAKVMASEAAIKCAKEAMQIHGGIGYTWEHDLHLYLRRAFATEDLLGTTTWHLDRIAIEIL